MVATSRWLDKVLAVPAVGLATHSWLGFASGVWDAIERTNASWKTDGLGQVSINVTNAVDIRVNRDRGLYLALTPSSVVAGYTFNMAAESKPGALPQLKSDTEEKSFGELQEKATAMLTEFIRLGFGASKDHEVIRVGIVAETRLIESEAPPGIVRYIKDLESAVRNRLTAVDGSMLAEVRRRDDGHDQCHHHVTRNVLDQPEDLGFRLDWQRVWQPPRRMNTARLLDEVKSATDSANVYFESFGSGEI